MRKGHDFKDFICPDTFEFEKDYFKIGDRYGRVIFLREYAAYIKDSMVAELCELNRNMMLSVDVVPVPTDEAVREVENRLLGVETNITNWQRKQNQNNNFSVADGYGHILILHDGICPCRLVEQHLVVLPAVLIQSVIRHRDKDGLLKIRLVQAAVVDGDFRGRSAVEGIEQLRVFKEHGFLVFTARHGIVDVLKLECFCVLVPAHEGVAVGLYFLLRPQFGTETLSWMCILGASPFAMMGFIKYNGMTAEQFVWAWIKSEFLMPKKILFSPDNLYYEAMKPTLEAHEKGLPAVQKKQKQKAAKAKAKKPKHSKKSKKRKEVDHVKDA